MSTMTPAMKIQRPDITTIMGEDHYKVSTPSTTYVPPSRWKMAGLMLAGVVEKGSKALLASVLVGLAVGIPVASIGMVDAVATPVVMEMRNQTVPQSELTLVNDAQ